MSLRVVMVALLTLAVSATTTATAAHAEPTVGELTAQIEKASGELEDIVESYNKLNEELKQTKDAEGKLDEQMKPVKAQLDSASKEIGGIANQAYKQGGVTTANALLSDSNGFIDRMSVLEQISRKRQRQVKSYTDASEKFTEQQSLLHNSRQKQEAQIAEIDARKGKIESDLKKLMDLRKARDGTAQEKSKGAYGGQIPSIAGSAGTAVTFAYKQIGKPYGWGDDGPGSYDCSGLTLAAWRAAGKTLPHNAAMQHSKVGRISRSALQPGDLVFYRNDGHVALYVGNDKVIDAPHAGANVDERSINIMPPTGYGRVR